MAKSAARSSPIAKTSPAKNSKPSAARPTNGSSTVAAPSPSSALPKSLVNALPVGAKIIQHVQAIETLYFDLQKQVVAAKRAGPVALARAYVVLHRLNERMLSDEKSFKSFKLLFRETKELTVPACFEQAGVPNVPLDEGFRVGVSVRTVASVKPGQKEAAFAYLEEIGKRDLIQETLNASTLSAFAKEWGEENKELPEDIFTVARMPNASVTKI